MEELHSIIAKFEENYQNGLYFEEEEMNLYIQSLTTNPYSPTENELKSAVQEAREDIKYGHCLSDEQISKEMLEW